jgi:peptidoglycan DL-endopeptidase CwlO
LQPAIFLRETRVPADYPLVMSSRRLHRRALLAVLLVTFVTGWASSSLASTPALDPAPTEADKEAAQERLQELERDFELVVERYNAVAERYFSYQTSMATTELAIRRLERDLSETRGDAVSLATEMYKDGSAEELEAMLSSHSVADIQEQLEYMKTSQEVRARTFATLEEDRRALEDKLASLDRSRGAAARSKERLAELTATIETKLAAQQGEIDALNAALERAQRRRARRERIEERRAAAAALAAIEASEASGRPSLEALGPLGAKLGAETPAGSNGEVVRAALSQLGKPYEWAADGPDTFDCSGLTMWAWAHAGVTLPHNSGMQYASTARVAQAEWRPGDLLFYGSPIHHVTMYIGDGKMIEAPYTGAFIRIGSPYRSDYVGAGRPS